MAWLTAFQFPYLHWDTFRGLQQRNALVKKRMEDPLNQPINDGVENGKSMENKLIWQYLMDSSGLPLHIRRSLDQFGNPTLEDTSVRDHDQVLYKCTKPESPLRPTNPSETLTRSAFQSVSSRSPCIRAFLLNDISTRLISEPNLRMSPKF